MKYLSAIAIVVLLGLSWWVYNQKKGLSADQQTRLQLVLKEYLAVYLQDKVPGAVIQDPEVLLKIIESGKKMEANFKFNYMETDPSGSQNKVARQGTFILTSENGNDWTAQMETINDTNVEFAEPFEIPREKLSQEEIDKALGEEPAPSAEEAAAH